MDNPRAFSEYNRETDTYCVMLTMVPRFSLMEVRSELNFVVDWYGYYLFLYVYLLKEKPLILTFHFHLYIENLQFWLYGRRQDN